MLHLSCGNNFPVPWFPVNVWELDHCADVVTKYEPEIDSRHPGFGDADYIVRRAEIAKLAAQFKQGDAIPIVEYTEEEHRTWREVYQKLKPLHELNACAEYRRNLATIEDEGLFTMDRVPQIRDVSCYLQRKTGFCLRPCGGLLSARHFLASLAFRIFQTTQYMRHCSSPQHSPEPDVVHELLGHVPMFADPLLAQFSQEIGLLSLGATDEHIEKLATVYWFIIEFGLCKEDGKLRAIGAGLLSSFGELQFAISNGPIHPDFEPEITAIQPYQDDEYQPAYFVAESILDAMLRLRHYARSLKRPFSVVYDPLTRSVQKVCNVDDLKTTIDRLKIDLNTVTGALDVVSKYGKN